MTNRVSTIHDVRYRMIVTRLIEIRKRANLPQKDLAKRLNLTQPDISKIERLERRLDILEFLDWLNVIAEGDMELFNQLWNEINECYGKSKSCRKETEGSN